MRKWVIKNGVIEAVILKPKKVKQVNWPEPSNAELRAILDARENTRQKVAAIFRNI